MNSSGALAYTYDKNCEHMHRQMLATVSHDLKTPLATIIGSLDVYILMQEKLDDDKKHTLVMSALGEAYRLENFITNILDINRLENGMVNVRNERCNLACLIKECLARFGTRIKTSRVTLHAAKSIKDIYTDPILLSRAVGILLDNALKHAGKCPEINIEYGNNGQHAFVRVRDNGLGIASGKEEEIFFKQNRIAKNDQQNAGTGLGLAICKHIMELLSGSIDVQNCPEGGVAFTLQFASHS